MPEDQRPDPVGLCRFRLRRDGGEALDAAGKARRLRRDVGSRRSIMRACWSKMPRESGGNRSRPASIRARARSTGRSSNTRCATPSAATGSAARRRSTSTCRSASAPSTSTIRREEAAGDGASRHLRLDGALPRHPDRELCRAHFPLWLAPVQVVVATITSDADDYARKVVAKRLRAPGFGRSRSAQREDQLQGPRAFAGQGAGHLVCGKREAEEARSTSAGSARASPIASTVS
jgi:hypothetical protein